MSDTYTITNSRISSLMRKISEPAVFIEYYSTYLKTKSNHLKKSLMITTKRLLSLYRKAEFKFLKSINDISEKSFPLNFISSIRKKRKTAKALRRARANLESWISKTIEFFTVNGFLS